MDAVIASMLLVYPHFNLISTLRVIVMQFAFAYSLLQRKITVDAAVFGRYHCDDGMIYESILFCILSCTGCGRVSEQLRDES